MSRWGMVIDLRKCVGCQTCTLACKVAHGLGPDITRCRVIEQESGTYPDVTRVNISLRCMHCADAECVKACPTGATTVRDDGIVTVNTDECMGCRYCSLVCPYQARSFLGSEKGYFPEKLTEWEKKRYAEHQVGTVEKCDFCADRIDSGLREGLNPGEDNDATPVCVTSCIGKALYFGDMDDPTSEVSMLVKKHSATVLKEELGTKPSIYYISRG